MIKTSMNLLTLSLLLMFSTADADLITQFDFQQFTQNGSSANYPYLNFSLAVSQINDSQAQFRIANNSSIPSVVAQIYFEQGPFSGIDRFSSSPGTQFNLLSRNLNFPSGSSLTPSFTEAFGLQAASPSPRNGLAPEDYIDIVFNLSPEFGYSDLINQIDRRNCRIGLHVQSIGGDASSESFTTTSIPEPMTVLLLASGSLLLLRRRMT